MGARLVRFAIYGLVAIAYGVAALAAYAELSEPEPNGKRQIAAIAVLIAVALASGWALEAVNG